ncbi:hypothetical protein B0T19DRAFT_235939 [Cercophora scortea]|uniref:Uncharacterized protein n=1 Tax=Cercophora scortea TaxID=314031 RepID=A0AAE0IGF0_9PEZI|nr:hypothetical protein B0T19DRAFT_235939 [Cercophora scortea]
MYPNHYGYPNAAGGPAFNGAPPPQNPHLQPGPSQNQPQQMMYNTQQQPQQHQQQQPQQFPMGAQAAHFPAGPNPAMMGAAGPAGMMQNTAMAAMPTMPTMPTMPAMSAMPHMAANGQMAYQTPYTSSPYGAAIPSPAPPQPQLPANYMMSGPMPQYPMNPGMHPQQPMMQRMHPSQQNPAGMAVTTPQRHFNPGQGTPNNAIPTQQVQYAPPQSHGTPQSQTPTSAQPPTASVATPQTPTFPSTGQSVQTNGSSGVSTPQSPGTESREKERFALLLDINQELLYETIMICNSRAELKKEQAAAAESREPANSHIDFAEEERLANMDYAQCMRRLQANLAYMAALADRKATVQVPAYPAYLTSPPLNLNITLRVSQTQNLLDESAEKTVDPKADREERDRIMKDLYKKLQALFPGIDPKKEPVPQMPNARGAGQPQQQQGAMKMQNGQAHAAAVAAAGGQGSNHSSPGPGPQKTPQMTPQMGNAAAPPMLMAQVSGP